MTKPFIIDFERTGGFAGISLHTTIDSHSLSADESEELVRLLAESGLPEITPEPRTAGSFPDQFTYLITLQYGEERHILHMAEKQVPQSVKPLLSFLTKRSRRKNENPAHP